MISGLDFNPAGEYVATINTTGVCLIHMVFDVNTNNYRFHKELGGYSGKFDF